MPGTFFSHPRLHNNVWIDNVRLKTRQKHDAGGFRTRDFRYGDPWVRQKNMTQVGFEPETFDMGTLGSYQLDYGRLVLIYLVGQLFDPPPQVQKVLEADSDEHSRCAPCPSIEMDIVKS